MTFRGRVKNTNILRCLALAASLSGVVVCSASAGTDWQKQFAGLDGISVICVSSFDSGIAEKVCEDLSEHLTRRADEIGAPTDDLGYVAEQQPRPKAPTSFATPLNVTIFIRGATNPDGLFISTRASVAYAAAIEPEAGDSDGGRAGELVLYERSTLGTGPMAQLQPAMIAAAKDRLEPFLVRIEENWGK